ncbi:sulfite oxidase-like oxidoreductase [Vulcanisaeta souniana]|uniref:Sulfite oxidase-like oxidoreductase n=1 Tax=Vulcanisaeta souniana JCM 11219 TaxID=1293586 RepID=A0A830E9W0_9CREN|nr:sulfite oxidase-like oxidoreductase [Vulcanisaeta souniana]BDR93233.1 sulfite oxidase-like oxidoreductase [Vulcanisaeta souniana JCM 11219]GGI78624.1 sulfite oxidase-like oxidoreductase [Vulcanisaeta souniana JCM 11219]
MDFKHKLLKTIRFSKIVSNVNDEVFRLALNRPCNKLTYKRELPPNQRVIPRFIIYDVHDPPKDIDLLSYRLRVMGLVENKVEIAYVDLLTKVPCIDLVTDFHCVTGWSIQNVAWRGVPTRYVMDMAKPRDNYVMAVGIDGYTTNLPLSALLEETTIIAYAMNGKILPRENGFPLRLVVPSRYGWKSAKYLSELIIMDSNEPGYWESLGYHDNGDPWLEERFNEGGPVTMRRRVRVVR